MSPDEKNELMERLQSLHYTVRLCEDGVNDCGILKAIDIDISLSEVEASIVVPFTLKIFDISCILDVIKEGRPSLVTSFAYFQYMNLYFATHFITVSILYIREFNLVDFQFLYITICVSLFQLQFSCHGPNHMTNYMQKKKTILI